MLVALACAAPEPSGGRTDDAGDPLPPRAARTRIVSLSPATTELLFALGVGDRVVGRTHWDAWPPAARDVPDMGDGIRPNVEVVLSTRPDLVVLYATGDNRDAARAFRAAGIDVLSLRMDRIEEFERATRILGDVLGTEAEAGIIVDTVRATLERVRLATRDLERPSVFLLSWPNPLLTIGAGSFLSQLVEIAGGRNLFDDLPDPSPAVSFEEVLRRDPDVVLAGPQRLAMMGASALWNTLPAVREGRMLQLDTALTGRPGVRLGEAAVSIARLLHPERVR